MLSTAGDRLLTFSNIIRILVIKFHGVETACNVASCRRFHTAMSTHLSQGFPGWNFNTAIHTLIMWYKQVKALPWSHKVNILCFMIKKYSGVSEPVWLSSVIFLFFKGVACLVNNIVFKRLIVYKALVYHSRVSTLESVCRNNGAIRMCWITQNSSLECIHWSKDFINTTR